MKILIVTVGILVAAFLLIQFVPYGRDHSNPAVIKEIPWQTGEARALAQRACYDCHSNETTWPWYSNIAPLSWLAQKDVEEGRSYLNFSEWGSRAIEIGEIPEVIAESSMPPIQYLILHPTARLNSSEKEVLINGFPGMTAAVNKWFKIMSHTIR